MDTDHSKKISFSEFIVNIWDFLTLDLDHFIFEMYDTDDSHQLSRAEFEEIALCAYGIPFGKNHKLDSAILRTDSDLDGKISFQEFREFVKRDQAIGYPGYQMQLTLMDHIGGQDFWKTLKEKRHNMHKNMSVHKILCS
jgi:hypothetical protein